MLDELMNDFQKEASEQLVSLGVPNDNTLDVMNIAKSGFLDHLKTSAENDTLSDLTGLLNGSDNLTSNPLVENMIGSFASQLGSKIGLSPEIAQSASNYLVPAILSKIKASAPENGFDDENIKRAIAGPEGLAGVVDKVKGMFT